MPPTATKRGSGLSRSEAAILAWKKRPRAAKPGALDPKIAARVKEILAAKQKKGKPKAGGKGKAAKPKDARTKQEKANQNRAAVAKQGGMGKLEGVMVRLGAGMNSDLEKDAHDELISKGLAKRGADGKPKLTPAGKKWRSAADKGDAEGAGAALAEGRGAASESAAREQEKGAKQAERETAKAGKVAERAAKQKQQQAAAKQKVQARQKIAADKAKTKAAAPAKEKPADAAKKQADNRAKVAKDMADQDAGLSPSGSAALGDFADGKPLKEETAKQFEAMGLAEKGADGAHRLTADGKAAANAMSKGDTRAAIDAISRAGSKKAKANQPKAKKAIDMSDILAIKAGARHSRTDMQHLQGIHDSAVACGASCGADEAARHADDPEAEAAIKGIMDNPAWYASHECGDIMQGCSALQTLAMLIQSELSEEDEDDASIGQLVDAAETLVEFIQGELTELRGAAGAAAALPNSASVQTMKAADGWHLDGGAIKAIGDDDEIEGCAVLYGTKATHDLEKDYYDKNTDLWLNHFGWPKPITYHHGMDAGTRDDPVVGHWTKATVTDQGVWLTGQLDRAHRYYKAIKELAQRGYLKMSSDSGPQWVIREPQSKGANYVKRWPLVTSSVTVTPMEPRMFPVEVKAFLAELGYEAIENDNQEAANETGDRHDGAKAGDERARALLLELDILQLEETAL